MARLNILCELTLPCARIGGLLIAMKGESGSVERAEAEKGIQILGGRVQEEVSFAIRNGDKAESRNLILVRKIAHTPVQYPRRYAKIAEKPL